MHYFGNSSISIGTIEDIPEEDVAVGQPKSCKSPFVTAPGSCTDSPELTEYTISWFAVLLKVV